MMARRFERYQIDALKSAYGQSKRLTKETKDRLKRITGLDLEQISSWYNRTRAHERARESLKELRRINAELKRSMDECSKREVRLQKELQESKDRMVLLEDENRSLKHRLAIAEGDIPFDYFHNKFFK